MQPTCIGCSLALLLILTPSGSVPGQPSSSKWEPTVGSLQQCLELAKQKRYADALAMLDQAEQQTPSQARTRFCRGLAPGKMGSGSSGMASRRIRSPGFGVITAGSFEGSENRDECCSTRTESKAGRRICPETAATLRVCRVFCGPWPRGARTESPGPSAWPHAGRARPPRAPSLRTSPAHHSARCCGRETQTPSKAASAAVTSSSLTTSRCSLTSSFRISESRRSVSLMRSLASAMRQALDRNTAAISKALCGTGIRDEDWDDARREEQARRRWTGASEPLWTRIAAETVSRRLAKQMAFRQPPTSLGALPNIHRE